MLQGESNKTFCLSQADLLPSLTRVSIAQDIFSHEKYQLNSKLVFWLKRRRLGWKRHITWCDFYIWSTKVKFYPSGQNFHSWAICPWVEAHHCQAMAPTDLSCRLVDKLVTHILGRCLQVLFFVTIMRLGAEGGKHQQLRDSAKAFQGVRSPWHSALCVSSSMWDKGACGR